MELRAAGSGVGKLLPDLGRGCRLGCGLRVQVLFQDTMGLALQWAGTRGRAGTRPAAHYRPPAPSCSTLSLFLPTSCSHRGGGGK